MTARDTNEEHGHRSAPTRYRLLNEADLDGVRDFDRSDYSGSSYKMVDGELALTQEPFDHRGWNDRQRAEVVAGLEASYAAGGVFFGAFDGDALVGICGIENKWRGSRRDTLNLGPLWVTKGSRGRGVGRKLVELSMEKAATMGAGRLYVSAAHSVNTVRFWLGVGCTLTDEIDEELFRLEPADIHMELMPAPGDDPAANRG
ncbi:MAG: GNAT family N-acetyltransferase [SAR202 cluster bacterium]|nr:GNAT family N-acetyltransferase [SAR202 cluster bacterium]